MEILNERPFELCDIPGFGFKTVDSIARKIKCKPNDKMRIKAAAKHIITEMKSEGHVFMDQQELRDKCFELLNDDLRYISVTHDEIRDCIIELIRSQNLINNNGNIYTYEYHGSNNVLLAFPTEEMRDAFYENFKDLIEQCKELL